MEGLEIIGLCLIKMWWLWVPPTVLTIVFCIKESKEERRKRNRSEDNYLK